MTCHFPHLGSASDWLKKSSYMAQAIRSNTQIWVVVHHQYGIFGFVSQMSFRRETSAGVAKCQLFSQAKARRDITQPLLYKVQGDRSPQDRKNSYH